MGFSDERVTVLKCSCEMIVEGMISSVKMIYKTVFDLVSFYSENLFGEKIVFWNIKSVTEVGV